MISLTGAHPIALDRTTVWAGLFDLVVLQESVPGCEALDDLGDGRYAARVVLKVGPIKARFQGEIALSDLNAPESFRITGTGQGGIAGFARGSANVRIDADPSGSILVYDAQADVGGRLAQLGGRLIEGTVSKLAEQFFSSFVSAVERRQSAL